MAVAAAVLTRPLDVRLVSQSDQVTSAAADLVGRLRGEHLWPQTGSIEMINVGGHLNTIWIRWSVLLEELKDHPTWSPCHPALVLDQVVRPTLVCRPGKFLISAMFPIGTGDNTVFTLRWTVSGTVQVSACRITPTTWINRKHWLLVNRR